MGVKGLNTLLSRAKGVEYFFKLFGVFVDELTDLWFSWNGVLQKRIGRELTNIHQFSTVVIFDAILNN